MVKYFLMQISTKLNWLKENLLDLIFPVQCLSCGLEGKYLCLTCQLHLKRCEIQICPVCGKRSVFGLTHQNCCSKFSLDGLISAVPYNEPLTRKLVEHLKYQFIKDVALSLADVISEEVRNLEVVNYFQQFVIVPLPLHTTRLRWRGFNQAELIAEYISQNLSIPIEKDILTRSKKTKVQAELNDEDRIHNVKQAFTAQPNSLRIILIDDVSTTRSTLSQACVALKSAGAKEVWGIVFAQG
jgi:competence protein ComFC